MWLTVRRRIAAVLYDGIARQLHVLFPGGRRLRAQLARSICESVGSGVNIAPGVRLSRHLTLGSHAGIGARSSFLGAGRIHLGERLKMGPECLFITNDHPVPRDDVSTFSDLAGTSKPIVVGNDVFIGARVIVLPGVCIGDGAAVGAGSLVTKDIPSGCTAAGNPARIVRSRSAQ